mmetsp:Transcript_14297/g.22293  ORF Transcript_14297/g.22293 Transcript_14297/m.22293 type:complete len:208 (-) Transcript_14297:126-749(-)
MKEAVKTMFSKEISLKTCKRLVARYHDEFSSVIVKPLGSGRVKLGLYERAMKWVDTMSTFLEAKRPPSKAVVNYDESRIHLIIEGKLKIRRLVSKSKKSQTKMEVKGTHCGTFLPFVSAAGELLRVYFVFRTKFDGNDTASVTSPTPSHRPEPPRRLPKSTSLTRDTSIMLCLRKSWLTSLGFGMIATLGWSVFAGETTLEPIDRSL